MMPHRENIGGTVAHDPIPDPLGRGHLVDVGSQQGRRAYLLSELGTCDGSHDTLVEMLHCLLIRQVEAFIARAMTSRTGSSYVDDYQYALMFAHEAVAPEGVNLYATIMLGELATVMLQAHNNEPIPEDYVTAWHDMQKGQRHG